MAERIEPLCEHLATTSLVDLLPDRARHLAGAAVDAVALVWASYLLRERDQHTPGLQFPWA